MQNSFNDLFKENLVSIQKLEDFEENQLNFLSSYNALKLSFNELNFSVPEVNSKKEFDDLLKKRETLFSPDKKLNEQNENDSFEFQPKRTISYKDKNPICKERNPVISKNNVKAVNVITQKKIPRFSFQRNSQELNIEKPKYSFIKTKPLIKCNCSKSKCLKLYCKCFAAGLVCGLDCDCANCFNEEKHKDIRETIIAEIISKNPKAFNSKFKKHEEKNQLVNSRGCNCSKTGCVKEYCRCYKANTGCSTLCRCMGCKNKKIELKPEEVKIYYERIKRKRSKTNLFEKYFGNKNPETQD